MLHTQCTRLDEQKIVSNLTANERYSILYARPYRIGNVHDIPRREKVNDVRHHLRRVPSLSHLNTALPPPPRQESPPNVRDHQCFVNSFVAINPFHSVTSKRNALSLVNVSIQAKAPWPASQMVVGSCDKIPHRRLLRDRANCTFSNWNRAPYQESYKRIAEMIIILDVSLKLHQDKGGQTHHLPKIRDTSRDRNLHPKKPIETTCQFKIKSQSGFIVTRTLTPAPDRTNIFDTLPEEILSASLQTSLFVDRSISPSTPKAAKWSTRLLISSCWSPIVRYPFSFAVVSWWLGIDCMIAKM